MNTRIRVKGDIFWHTFLSVTSNFECHSDLMKNTLSILFNCLVVGLHLYTEYLWGRLLFMELMVVKPFEYLLMICVCLSDLIKITSISSFFCQLVVPQLLLGAIFCFAKLLKPLLFENFTPWFVFF